MMEAMAQRENLSQQFHSSFARGISESWEEVFSKLDTNGDGCIDYGEFLSAACNKQKLINQANLWAAFNILDMNGDGMIDTDEIAKRFTYSNLKEMTDQMDPERDEEFWLKLIDEFDDDGDGKISFEEFESNMIRMVEDAQARR